MRIDICKKRAALGQIQLSVRDSTGLTGSCPPLEGITWRARMVTAGFNLAKWGPELVQVVACEYHTLMQVLGEVGSRICVVQKVREPSKSCIGAQAVMREGEILER